MPTTQESQVLPTTRTRILSHFKKNPRAMDTARGIARWWIGSSHKCVEEELESLVQEGKLEKVGDGQRTIYRLPTASVPRSS